jgi:4-amino-4-deoxy-L-arabinose transferase-like glycosyltransferase
LTFAEAPAPEPVPIAWRALLALAVLAAGLHVVPDLFGGYGYFIDELYYLSCARRLAFGYVDHPPLAPLLLRGVTTILGEGIVAIRLLPAIGAGVLVLLTGWLTARLGGGRRAQVLAGLATLASPYLLVIFGFFSMNWLEPLVWTGLVAIVVEMVRRGDPRLWLAFGALAGVGLQAKHTILTVAGALVVGLALTKARRLLASSWLLLGGLIALAIAAPNALWQMAHGWPSLEFYRNANAFKNLPTAPLAVIANQVLFMNPVTLPLWLAGLGFFLFSRDGRSLRSVAWAYLLLLGALIAAQSSRPDRLGAFYPALLAAGAVVTERAASRHRWLMPTALTVLLAGIVAFAPLGLPVLPPAMLARYVAALGIVPQIERGEGKRAELPQWFADRFGWEQLVAQTVEVYRSLPPDERARALIVAPSYGHAGAVERFWPEEAHPPVVSTHNTWFFWSRDVLAQAPFDVAIGMGGREGLAQTYAEIEQVALYDCDYCIAWRDRMPIYVARRPRVGRQELLAVWERGRHFE